MNHYTTDPVDQLNTWYQKPLGVALARAIKQHLDCKLPELLGDFLLQLGIDEQQAWLEKSPVRHKFILTSTRQRKTSAIVECSALPFTDESIDVVFLPHTLEMVVNPDRVLSEVFRIIVPEGYLLIAGFNPLSLWGVHHLLKITDSHAPWRNHFMSMWRLRRTLVQLGFMVTAIEDIFYRPPVQHENLLNKLMFLETLGRMVWIYPGASYLLLAKKQATTLQLIRPIWQLKQYVIGKSFAEPISPDVV